MKFFPRDHSRDSLLAAQKLVASRVTLKDDFGVLERLGGVDQAFIKGKIISGMVVLDYSELKVIERAYSIKILNYPYIPTFLTFREGPAIISVFNKTKLKPDLLLVDGAGINHPRKAGLATHIGVALDIPTIGITKSILCGEAEIPFEEGKASPLVYAEEQVGWLLKSCKKCRPIVIAPGHKVSLSSSLSIAQHCLLGHKLPEPLRLSHIYVNQVRKTLL